MRLTVILFHMKQDYKLSTLENLERQVWPAVDTNEESYLVITCNSLRKKPLVDFSIEDLRIMIGQNIGLKYLVPIAVEKLNENIVAEGNFYEGDLLTTVLKSDTEFWKADKLNHKIVCEIFQKNEAVLKEFETTSEIKKTWFDSFKNFELINRNNN